MVTTYTSSNTYWAPLKPRIRIYAFSDSSYSSPLYSYNPFTDAGTTTKPISLSFDSQTTNAGSFSIEIEDADNSLDLDTFTRGNRVFIDCSKDGSTFQPAFKGLVRSSEQTIYAPTGRNFTISGYSYLIRLNERILNVVKESALSGTDYDRTDSSMFTNNLIEDLLTTNTNYVDSADDRELYNLPNPANISSSPITDWIPRLDAELITVGNAIDSILEYSNSLITVDLSNDEWVVYNPELTTSLTQVFLITDEMTQAADDADITMYPLAPYKYAVSYDYPDSASRLIVALSAGGECPEITEPPLENPCESIGSDVSWLMWHDDSTNIFNYMYASEFKATQTDMSNFSMRVSSNFNMTSLPTDMVKLQVRTKSGSSHPNAGSQVGSVGVLYRDREIDKEWPNYTACRWTVGLAVDDPGPSGLTIDTKYWAIVYSTTSANVLTYNNMFGIHQNSIAPADTYMADYNPTYTGVSGGWPNPGNTGWEGEVDGVNNDWLSAYRDGPFFFYDFDFNSGVIQDPCGGALPTSEIPEPQFVIAHDLNASNRLGIVERAVTSLPRHITTLQTINEFLYAKLYVAAKPRFVFDYPSVTMPGKIPKAGDIVTHVAGRAGVGLMTQPLQTGVIMSVSYDFAQDDEGTLGLRKMSLQTTGLRRGSY